jgi:putative flippase GtrA
MSQAASPPSEIETAFFAVVGVIGFGLVAGLYWATDGSRHEYPLWTGVALATVIAVLVGSHVTRTWKEAAREGERTFWLAYCAALAVMTLGRVFGG